MAAHTRRRGSWLLRRWRTNRRYLLSAFGAALARRFLRVSEQAFQAEDFGTHAARAGRMNSYTAISNIRAMPAYSR